MPILKSELGKKLNFTRPEPPKPEDFCYTHVLDWRDIERLQSDPGYTLWLKSKVADALADHIIEKSQAFQLPSGPELLNGAPIRIHVVINDRGAFQNWLPIARDEGRAEGVVIGKKKGAISTLESLPYGTNPTEFWE